MIDLTLIENDIKSLEAALRQRKKDYEQAKEANLKEKYGDDFGCGNCAYSCCLDVGDYHTSCTQGHCIHCRDYCDRYIRDNELSAYIKEHHRYDESVLDSLNDLLDVNDIMKHPLMHQAALEILKIVDKENNNETN